MLKFHDSVPTQHCPHGFADFFVYQDFIIEHIRLQILMNAVWGYLAAANGAYVSTLSVAIFAESLPNWNVHGAT